MGIVKPSLQTDFSTTQGYTGLVPVAMTDFDILSGAKRSRRICMATACRLPEGHTSFCLGIIQDNHSFD